MGTPLVRTNRLAPRLTGPTEAADGVAFVTTQIVNAIFLGQPGASTGHWVLVDTGMPGNAERVARAAAQRFGHDSRPAAIILTHGHFDHVGGVRQLAARWDVPVFAHELEFPYLTGRSSYPPADPTVGGGAMARLSPMFPRRPIQLGERLQPLPDDGTVPGTGEWKWLFTPGHSPGHVSLWRESDRTLIAGDAFCTCAAESFSSVMRQLREVHGPPAYFTIDWDLARSSVEQLAALRPSIAIAGHGLPIAGAELQNGLEHLAQRFDFVARPARGRYVVEPARTDGNGVVFVPPPLPDPVPRLVAGAVAGVVVGASIAALRRRN